MCSKLAIETQERHSDLFACKSQIILDIIQMFQLLLCLFR